MALYEYDLYLIREFDKGELLPDIINAGFLQPIDNEEGTIIGQVNCFFREVINQQNSASPLRIVKLEIDDVQFETLLHANGKAFILWMQAIVKNNDIAYAFIGGGAAAAYYEEGGITAKMVFNQVGHLIETGAVEIVHPVMFFSERLGQGKTCRLAKGAPYTVYEIPGVGCLLLLISTDAFGRTLEILDPGSLYPRLRDYFRK